MDRSSDIVNALLACSIRAYLPGVHPGVCTAPYAVVQMCGASVRTESRMGGSAGYRVHIFVPAERPAMLEPFACRVQEALRPLERSGVLRLTAPRSPAAVSDRFAALGCQIEYTSEYRA